MLLIRANVPLAKERSVLLSSLNVSPTTDPPTTSDWVFNVPETLSASGSSTNQSGRDSSSDVWLGGVLGAACAQPPAPLREAPAARLLVEHDDELDQGAGAAALSAAKRETYKRGLLTPVSGRSHHSSPT